MTTEWLNRALEESRARGFLGPGSISPHLDNASSFAAAVEAVRGGPPKRLLDLGSGGGLPGLWLADHFGATTWLLDAMAKRTNFLSEVGTWEGAPNLVVVTGRAEELARRNDLEGMFDVVTARSFGPPATTAECAVRFLEPQGHLLVSEPPGEDGPDRWDPVGLDRLGLLDRGLGGTSAVRIRILEKVAPTPDDFPRRDGVPRKRPLF